MKILLMILLFAGWFIQGTAQKVEKKAVENTTTSITVSAHIGSKKQEESPVMERTFISVTEQVKAIVSLDKKTEVEDENPNQYKTLKEAAMSPVRNHQPMPPEKKME